MADRMSQAFRQWLTPQQVAVLIVNSVFPGGVGRTIKPADFQSLFEGVKTKIFDQFSDDIVVYPGHGDDTTLGAERPHLDEWRRRGW